MAKGNFTKFWDKDNNIFWFSYETLVAFKYAGNPVIVHENDWKTTTGKHLNQIDGGGLIAKKQRLSAIQFDIAYRRAFNTHFNHMNIERLG